jgi:hypothetical protein
MSRPTYVGPGSTPALPRPAYMCFGRNIRRWARLFQFWPIPAENCRIWAGTAESRPVWAGAVETWRGPGHLHPGGPAPPSSRPAHPGLLSAAAPPGHPGWVAGVGWPKAPTPGWAGVAGPARSAPAGPAFPLPGWAWAG